MNGAIQRPTCRKKTALIICSFLLTLSGCGCSETHEHTYALYVACDDSLCTAQVNTTMIDIALVERPLGAVTDNETEE